MLNIELSGDGFEQTPVQPQGPNIELSAADFVQTSPPIVPVLIAVILSIILIRKDKRKT